MKQVIHCGQLFTAVDGAVQKDMALCLNDEKIEKVCPFAEAETDGAKIIDLSDKFVMPGLIDAHVHTCADGAAGSFSGDGSVTLLSCNAKSSCSGGHKLKFAFCADVASRIWIAAAFLHTDSRQ